MTMESSSAPPAELRFQTSWTVWGLTKGGDWQMNPIFAFTNLAEFWQHFNAMKTPSECGSIELAIFRTGVEPDWEKEPCSQGGRWSARLDRVSSNDSLDQAWINLLLGMVGGSLAGGKILGAAYSGKGQHSRRVAVWLCTREKEEVLQIGNAIKDNLRTELSDKDIGEMLFHDFDSGNKAFAVIANTGKRRTKTTAVE